MLENFGDVTDHEIILGGDFNFVFSKELDTSGITGDVKLRSIAAITKIMEKYDLIDIYRVRHPDKKS